MALKSHFFFTLISFSFFFFNFAGNGQSKTYCLAHPKRVVVAVIDLPPPSVDLEWAYGVQGEFPSIYNAVYTCCPQY